MSKHARLSEKSQTPEIGLIGRLFGGSTEKPGNIAGLAIILSIVLIGLVIFFAPDIFRSTEQIYTLFGGIITLALGYLFGKSQR